MEFNVRIFQCAPKVPLGEMIAECDIRNSANQYTIDNLKGISIEKKFIETKAKMDGVSLLPYKIVKPEWMAFVPVTSRNGGKISLAFNDTDDETYIVSSAYTVVKVQDEERLNANYLFLMLQRAEFDRLARFNSWGSARETFTFSDLQRYEIPLPSIDVQKQYVNAYRSLQKLAEQNEALAAPLKNACMSYLSDAQRRYDVFELGNFITGVDFRNCDNIYGANSVKGLATSKKIIETKANLTGVSLTSYKIFPSRHFAYVEDTSRRGDKVSMAFNSTSENWLLSSISTVFKIIDEETLSPEYLYLFFCRSEFDRLARFNSWGSARETFPYQELQRVKIPLPPIEVQRSIVALYNCAEEARAIAREAREQLKKMAPAMVQRAANTPQEV
ncbi:MAG: restriction endonuclease subunit S [Sodaliphilus sp.]|nr:restriction endonuclease subunit S [Sodaliphilus sp.]